jgi:hypothetical protein
VERSIPSSIFINSGEIINQNTSHVSIFRDKLLRFYSMNYVKARIKKQHGNGISGKDSIMYFLNGKIKNTILIK